MIVIQSIFILTQQLTQMLIVNDRKLSHRASIVLCTIISSIMKQPLSPSLCGIFTWHHLSFQWDLVGSLGTWTILKHLKVKLFRLEDDSCNRIPEKKLSVVVGNDWWENQLFYDTVSMKMCSKTCILYNMNLRRQHLAQRPISVEGWYGLWNIFWHAALLKCIWNHNLTQKIALVFFNIQFFILHRHESSFLHCCWVINCCIQKCSSILGGWQRTCASSHQGCRNYLFHKNRHKIEHFMMILKGTWLSFNQTYTLSKSFKVAHHYCIQCK